MPDKEAEPEKHLPAPMISKRQDRSRSLKLDEVDMSRNGVQGDAVVSKGRAGTFVTKVSEDGS